MKRVVVAEDDQDRDFDLRGVSAVVDQDPGGRGANDPARIGVTERGSGFDHARVRAIEEQRAEFLFGDEVNVARSAFGACLEGG